MNLTLLGALLAWTGSADPAHAGPRCLESEIKRHLRVLNESVDTEEQWLLWEEQSNVPQLRKPAAEVPIKLVAFSDSQVVVDAADYAPADLVSLFVRDRQVLFPQHPYNTHPKVPGAGKPARETAPGRFTASRSIAMRTKNGRLVSAKMGTNWLVEQNPKAVGYQEKYDLSHNILISRRRSDLVTEVDSMIGEDSELIILKDVLSIREKSTGNGFVVRDLSPMQDGHYYLPAFSIPFEGRRIADLMGVPFEKLWGKSYAALLGRAKAKLLLRYGIQMQTPNAQNMLIQLDRNLRPTGKIVFRDIGDSRLMPAAVNAIGKGDALKADAAMEGLAFEELHPRWHNSTMYFAETGIQEQVLNHWGDAHTAAYLQEIETALGVKIPGADPANENVTSWKIEQYLQSDGGRRALWEYHLRLWKARRRSLPPAPPGE